MRMKDDSAELSTPDGNPMMRGLESLFQAVGLSNGFHHLKVQRLIKKNIYINFRI